MNVKNSDLKIQEFKKCKNKKIADKKTYSLIF